MQKNQIIKAALLALATTLFLFYIDEGYYNFRWMQYPSQWIIFFVYALFLFSGQVLVLFLLSLKSGLIKNSFLKYLLGLATGLVIALLFFKY